jgi:hypothetical protein
VDAITKLSNKNKCPIHIVTHSFMNMGVCLNGIFYMNFDQKR